VTAECPRKLWCLLSGGKDSMTTAHVLASENRLAGCAFLDTGIAAPDVRPFVEAECDRRGWPLEVYRTPAVYEDLVLKFGFPGPGMHGLVMNYLKGRGIRRFKAAHPGEALASGVRRAESSRRFRNTKPESIMERVRVYAPIFDWTTERVWAYLRANDLPVSPAYKTLHLSGDCLCGSFADRSEVHMIRTFYPELAERIEALERRAARTGLKRRRWGGGAGGPGFSARESTIESFVCGGCASP